MTTASLSLETAPPTPRRPRMRWMRRTLLGPLLVGTIALFMCILLFAQTFREQAGSRELLLPTLSFTLVLIFLLTATLGYQELYFHVLSVRRRNDEEKATFVRMAADTIRTPLTGLRWLTELFLAGELGDISTTQKESIHNMETAIRRLINLVNELLSVMKMSGGIVQYHPRPSDVNALVRRAMEDMRAVAGAKRQQIVFGQISHEVAFLLDEPLIRHVLGALLGSAIKLAQLGGTIIMHVESTEERIAIGITYTGEGLAFKSMESPERLPEEGSLPANLGDVDLTVSWEILSAARGRFWVRNRAPEYTLFISLPRIETRQVVPPQSAPPSFSKPPAGEVAVSQG